MSVGLDRSLDLKKARPHLPEEDLPALLGDFEAILRSGVLTMGPYLDRFEADFARAAGVRHAVGMSSGTAPLEVALRFWEVAGGEVVMTTNTFMATVHAAILAGGTPVLADIDPGSLSSRLEQIRPHVGAAHPRRGDSARGRPHRSRRGARSPPSVPTAACPCWRTRPTPTAPASTAGRRGAWARPGPSRSSPPR